MNASSRLFLADARSFAASASVFLKNSAFSANSRAASASRRARAAAACSAWNTFSRFLYESGCHDLRCRYWWDQPEPPAAAPEVARAAPACVSGLAVWAYTVRKCREWGVAAGRMPGSVGAANVGKSSEARLAHFKWSTTYLGRAGTRRLYVCAG